MNWYTLGEWTEVSNEEARLASQLCTVLDTGDAEVLSVSTLDINGPGDTTVLVAERLDERLLFIKRLDGSIVLATNRWDLS